MLSPPVCRSWICALLLTTVIVGGCASKDTYRYDNIKTEYADLVCNPEQPSSADGSSATCAIDSRLNIEKVLTIARTNNPDLLMAMARIEQARAMLDRSAAPFYPQVKVYTEYLQGDAPSICHSRRSRGVATSCSTSAALAPGALT